jgi:wyosine [tRNA(Phe)-imidazoG37] synthetase (radical SAM superfamily)
MAATYHHLFGPVPSRRFGRSLGVDLTPHKTCSQDCVFCQLGPTLMKTVTRGAFVPTDDVLRELTHWCRSGDWAKYITLSGSGEPTLHMEFGDVLDHIRMTAKAPAVLLTNGSLLGSAEVREAACRADIVKISLSAWNQSSFEHVNRPHPNLAFDRVVTGIHQFRASFSGQLWLEVFLVKGWNTVADDVARIAAIADRMQPDRIHLNTVDRPPAMAGVLPLSEGEMKALAALFHPKAEIPRAASHTGGWASPALKDAIVAMVGRRPCTSAQIADVFSANNVEVVKILSELVRTGTVSVQSLNDRRYFISAKTKDHSKHR